jgi:hypothetical protein
MLLFTAGCPLGHQRDNDDMKDAAAKALPLGLVDGQAEQVLNHAIGVAISWGLTLVGYSLEG